MNINNKIHIIDNYPSRVMKIIRFLRYYCMQWLLILSLFFAGGYMIESKTNFFTRVWNKITKNDNPKFRGPLPSTEF